MKSDAFFGLDHASWPALLVEAGGTIRHANQAAIQFFAQKLEGESTLLSAIWSPDNDLGADAFLSQWERSPLPTLTVKFRGRGAAPHAITTHICSLQRDGQKRYLFQLFPDAPIGGLAPAAGESVPGLKQKLDCAVQLTRSVALDCNNALTCVLGHASFVADRLEPASEWREPLQQVQQAAHKAARIMQNLAAFSRQEKDTHELAPGNLNSLVRRVAGLFQTPEHSGITWLLQLEGKLFEAKFDEPKFQQALAKVVENAVQALGTTGHLTIHTRNEHVTEPRFDGRILLGTGQYVCIEVLDSGPGIPADVLARIFEPFFTTKPGHRGLGLAWVYGIMSNHDGSVSVASLPDRGTAVRLYLPAATRLIEEPVVNLTELGGTQTVLLVDDEELVLAMGRVVLSAFGYQVLTANSGTAALELIFKKTAAIDLLIVDLVLPLMSGRELIEKCRAVLPGVPIILTSGYARPASPHEDAAFLAKPFTTQALLSKVRHALTTAQAA